MIVGQSITKKMDNPDKEHDSGQSALQVTNKKRTYNSREMAELLGVSRDTIRRMRIGGELPPIIPTKRRFTRWKIQDVELWFEFDCPPEEDFVRFKRDQQRFARGRRSK